MLNAMLTCTSTPPQMERVRNASIPRNNPKKIAPVASSQGLGKWIIRYGRHMTRMALAPKAGLQMTSPQDQRPAALIGEQFQQDRMLHPAIDDIGRFDPAEHGVQSTFDLGQHAAADRAVLDQSLDLLAERLAIKLPCWSSRPVTLVSRISFSACSTSAILPATRSALML